MKLRGKLMAMAVLPLIMAVVIIVVMHGMPDVLKADKACVLTGVACVVIAIAFAGIAVLLGSSVLKGIRVIHDGMIAVAEGNLDGDVTIQSKDELGQLAVVFNRMRVELKNRQFALERESEEHKKTATSLRDSNRHLSDVLVKLKRAQQHAIEQERMQALSQIAGGIVHDFNSSLTPILGTTEYLLSTPETLKDTREVIDFLLLIDEAARTARIVVKDLAEFFRPSVTDIIDFINVNDVVQNAVSLTKPKWKAQTEVDGATITIVTDLCKEPPTIHGNRIELEEAVTNLILNAVDSMPTGGTITFKTSVIGDTSIIEVTDTGEGMPPDVKARCFEPFFSTKGPVSSGMGLSIVKTIIARHKGSVDMDSEQGKGTTITIHLPKQSIPPLKKAAISNPVKPAGGLRVLVVDDEAWSRRILQKYLADDGCAVEASVDGHDALAKLNASTFDVVILDRAMPEMSGDQLASYINKLHIDLPVIMLTGFADFMKARGEHPKDVDILIGKPFTKDDIRSAISEALAKRRG